MNENPQHRSAADEVEPDDEDAAGHDDPTVLSPAVRRLVKTYELDVTAIRGSGPSGRIRVGDVMAALGHRAAPGSEDGSDDPAEAGTSHASSSVPSAEAPPTATQARPGERQHEAAPTRDAPRGTAAEAAAPFPAAASTAAGTAAGPDPLPHAVLAAASTVVFECDLGGVLAHRQRERASGADVSLTAYFAAACAAALRDVPEANGGPDRPIAVQRFRQTGPARCVVADADRMPIGALSLQLAAPAPASPSPSSRPSPSSGSSGSSGSGTAAAFCLRNDGDAGAVLAVPVPLEPGAAASLGIGRPRRQVVLRNVDGQETPRQSAACFLSLSYDAAQLDFQRASRLLAEVVRRIEHWPAAS